MQSRFHPLKDKILILRKLVQKHDISAVDDLNEILPLLLGHTVIAGRLWKRVGPTERKVPADDDL